MSSGESKDFIKSATAASLAAATAAERGADAAGMAAAAAISFFPYVVGRCIPGILERREREAQEWWDRVVMDNGTGVGAAAEIKARANEPAVQETIFSGFRLVLEKVSPAVIPALGLLTREYARQGRGPDWFFRSVGRVLSDVSSDEYADLRALTALIAQASTGEVVLYQAPPDADGGPRVAIWHTITPPRVSGLAPGQLETTARRLFSVLKTSGLATEAPSGNRGQGSGPTVMQCERETFVRLAQFLV